MYMVHVHIHVHIYIHMYTRTLHMYTRVHVYTCVCTSVCTLVHPLTFALFAALAVQRGGGSAGGRRGGGGGGAGGVARAAVILRQLLGEEEADQDRHTAHRLVEDVRQLPQTGVGGGAVHLRQRNGRLSKRRRGGDLEGVSKLDGIPERVQQTEPALDERVVRQRPHQPSDIWVFVALGESEGSEMARRVEVINGGDGE